MTDDDDQAEQDRPGTFDNPAARIRYWLKPAEPMAAAVYSQWTQQQQGHANVELSSPIDMLGFWGEIWQINPDTPSGRIEWHRRAIGLVEAGAECRRLASTSKHYMAESLLANFDQVEGTLAHFMGGPGRAVWEMFGGIDTAGWTSLDHLNQFFSNETPQPELSLNQTQRILDEARSLADLIRESDLTEQDKMVLLDKVAEVEAAVARARIAGSADVAQAADGLRGGLYRVWLTGVDIMGNPATMAAFTLCNTILTLLGGVGSDHVTVIEGFGPPPALPPGNG